MGIFDKVLRAGEGRKLKRLAEIVPLINDLEDEMVALSDEALRAKTDEFKERLALGETTDDLLVEAFAVVREAAKRTIGQRHYDVQLMGGMALHFGWIAEMKTGEGKTLVSTLPVYLNALEGKGVHVVTVNDYLAQRDSEWMGRIYNFLGLSVGRVTPDIPDAKAKREAYLCDITYGTNTEFGFDYLRDNMARSLDDIVQRGHFFGIVDEVDSILIDEARTPLIISGPSDMSQELYYRFAGIVRTLKNGRDYEVDEEKKTVLPTEEGIERVEKALGIDNLFDISAMVYLHQLNQALRAKELYHRDRDYIVERGEIKIVDEFTGRTLEGRRWSEGLHQAVEAKERVRIKEENHTWATVTLQNYFRMYEKLSGMTGTAETEAAEFASTYGLQVIPIPTHRELRRIDRPDFVYKTEMGKFQAVVDDILERHESGQPVLVGTASVAKSELLSQLLQKNDVPHFVLNAKHHALEAQIVAQAGRLGAVTVATNMAGRGVDILLGGNPEGLALQEVLAQGRSPEDDEGRALYEETLAKYKVICKEEGDRVRELGGLYVLGSERHESRRIDNQLRGRSGRQGDPGESRFYLSLEDDLLRLFSGGAVSWMMQKTFPEDQPIEAKMVTKAIERAQTTVEGKNAEIRKEVLKYDEVLNEQRKIIYKRRRQVLEGEDLRERTSLILDEVVQDLVDTYCERDFQEEWDLDGLISAVKTYWPTKFVLSDLAQAVSKEQLVESLVVEAEEYYDSKEQRLPGGAETAREIEREVMLTVIDQKWREHLSEMDYLREGINLRAMGQQDPLVAWQREGYAMFSELMEEIDADYLRYVMTVDVIAEPVAQVDLNQASYWGANDPNDISLINPGRAVPLSEIMQSKGDDDDPAGAEVEESQEPYVKDDTEKLGRNEKCWCGSGIKFKHCHGKAS
ncbi:preprotein translocase subunit SecA [Ferrithrix thermotolerans DSM 19514]|uniref:Protein translocase subunit SecA n=1 Tax=Ferrithrix thermotolerans DSM 19514 TaxID=1121881 RepID=A0A1M4S6N8_9ACTN|nr:preprotein translocase subunit SecA [Ferrithrix thermotolerans]SHE27862.1 preprotein translocase subunit SecA [Ferrithrix thermotolerans DSM 19514]